MKVLVATHITQGDDAGDYCWAVDGELVTPVAVACSNPKCGCEWGFPGLASARATSTALVVDHPHIGRAELERAVRDSLARDGWIRDRDVVGENEELYDDEDDDIADDEFVAFHVDSIIGAANRFSIGTVVCRCGERVFAREALAA